MPTSDMDMWTALAREREGVRYFVYKDSLGKLTGGIGHLITAADPPQYQYPGVAIPAPQVGAWWAVDGQKALDAATAQAKEAGIDSQNFRVILASVNFQLGIGWRKTFATTWKLIVAGDYGSAAQHVEASIWAQQTPVRAADFVAALKALDNGC